VSEKLAIELDGGQHAASTTKDAVRTAYLEERGWRALRFWNNDVLANTEGVVGEVINALESPADLGG
jgi:very-short-patch-repair endonuclease